jgi:hypothetical protein
MEFTVTRPATEMLLTADNAFGSSQFVLEGSWGTLITGTDPSTGLATKIDLDTSNFVITVLKAQPQGTHNYLNLTADTSRVVYWPTAVEFTVNVTFC